MNNCLQSAAIILCAAAASVATPVSAQQWQGTWTTRFGEFRLFQSGDHVFGEYRDGTIEGIIDARTGRLRAPVSQSGWLHRLCRIDDLAR